MTCCRLFSVDGTGALLSMQPARREAGLSRLLLPTRQIVAGLRPGSPGAGLPRHHSGGGASSRSTSCWSVKPDARTSNESSHRGRVEVALGRHGRMNVGLHLPDDLFPRSSAATVISKSAARKSLRPLRHAPRCRTACARRRGRVRTLSRPDRDHAGGSWRMPRPLHRRAEPAGR